MFRTRAPVAVGHVLRDLPAFRRLLELRVASQFGDGLFQSALAGALLFNPQRETAPMAVAGAFAVLFLPYSLLGPFAGALMDRFDRRQVLYLANSGRLAAVAGVGAMLAAGANDVAVLCGALIVNGFARFVSSAMSAALPHVVPREQVVALNALATATGAVAAFLGADLMLVPRWLLGPGDRSAASIVFIAAIPVLIALALSFRFAARSLGPDEIIRSAHGSATTAMLTGWLDGARTVLDRPTVAATLAALTAHRMAFGVNTLLALLLVRHAGTAAVGGLGTAALFVAATGVGSLAASALTPPAVRRWTRYRTANGALAAAAVVQVGAAWLHLPVMVLSAVFLGLAGQVVKLCADAAMQVDVDDALRGHAFAVQDAVFWVSFVASITAAATVIPDNGHSPALALAGTALYVAGLAVHAVVGRRGQLTSAG